MKMFDKQICLWILHYGGFTFVEITLQKFLEIMSCKFSSIVINYDFRARITTESSSIQFSCCMLDGHVKHDCKLRPTGACITNCQKWIFFAWWLIKWLYDDVLLSKAHNNQVNFFIFSFTSDPVFLTFIVCLDNIFNLLVITWPTKMETNSAQHASCSSMKKRNVVPFDDMHGVHKWNSYERLESHQFGSWNLDGMDLVSEVGISTYCLKLSISTLSLFKNPQVQWEINLFPIQNRF